jgi:hypothetical protein
VYVSGRTGGGATATVGVATRYRLVEDRIPVEARFYAPVLTSPGANPACYTLGTGVLVAWR